MKPCALKPVDATGYMDGPDSSFITATQNTAPPGTDTFGKTATPRFVADAEVPFQNRFRIFAGGPPPLASLKPGPPLPSSTLPQPESPEARLLYDLATQLEHFDLSFEASLPIGGLGSKDPVETLVKTVLKNDSAMVLLDVKFSPYMGPFPILPPLEKIPVLGPLLFSARVLHLRMDPQTRHIRARVCPIPWEMDVHKMVLEKGFIPPEVVKGKNYDLAQGLPLYTWQMVDALVNMRNQPAKPAAGKTADAKPALGPFVPVWEKGTIRVEGNFSNRTLVLGDTDQKRLMTVSFAALPEKKTHRFSVTGKMTEPVFKLEGAKTVEVEDAHGRFKLVNEDKDVNPLTIRFSIPDPTFVVRPSATIDHYKSGNLHMEADFINGQGHHLTMDLKEGITMEGFSLTTGKDGEIFCHIKKMEARQLQLEGFGVSMKTESGDVATFEDVKLNLDRGRPDFSAQVHGRANGTARYFIANQEKGRIDFRFLKEAAGSVQIGPDEKNETRIRLAGAMEAELPVLRLLVQSEPLKAYAETEIEKAHVKGNGALSIWPYEGRILVESAAGGNAITVDGTQGRVRIGQKTAELPAWRDEIRRMVGATLAAKMATDVDLDIRYIRFSLDRLSLKSHFNPENKKAGLLIDDALMNTIRVVGDVKKGLMFLRLPGGTYYPLDLAQTRPSGTGVPSDPPPPPRISIGLDHLHDKLLKNAGSEDDREVNFHNTTVLIEPQTATFSERDQKRCGADKWHIHAGLSDFFFNPADREIRMSKPEHTHFVLANPFGSGCLVVK